MCPHIWGEHWCRGVAFAKIPPWAVKFLVFGKSISAGAAASNAARILPPCAPGAAPSATTLGTPSGVSCPRKAEAQILSCGRTEVFLQAAVVGGFCHSWAVLGTLCAERGAEHKQTAQAHPTPKTQQCLGNSRDTKGLHQPKQLDCGFQLSVPESCAVGPRSCAFMMMGMEVTPWSFLFSGFFCDGKFESSAFLGHQGPRNLLQGKMELVSPEPDCS